MFCAVFEDFVGFGDTVEQCVENVCAAAENFNYDIEDITPETCQFFECNPVGIRRAQWEFAFPE